MQDSATVDRPGHDDRIPFAGNPMPVAIHEHDSVGVAPRGIAIRPDDTEYLPIPFHAEAPAEIRRKDAADRPERAGTTARLITSPQRNGAANHEQRGKREEDANRDAARRHCSSARIDLEPTGEYQRARVANQDQTEPKNSLCCGPDAQSK